MPLRLLLLLAAALAACDGGLDPVVEDGPPFALHGALDGQAGTQRLRVQSLQGSLFETPDRLPATVTSTELGTGRTTTWRDSLVTLDDGARAHVFVADLDVAPGETHRVEAVHDDGRRSSATVALPDPVAQVVPPGPDAPVTVAVQVGGLRGVARGVELRYRVRSLDGATDTTFAVPATLQAAPGGASVLAYLASAEIRASRLLYGDDIELDPVFAEVRLVAVVEAREPAPVENGRGAVGWVTAVSVPVRIPAETLVRAGFVDGQ